MKSKSLIHKRFFNQRSMFIIKLLLVFFAFSIVLYIVIPNEIIALISAIVGVMCVFVAFIFFAAIGGFSRIGVPNNIFSEFEIPQKIYFEKEICIKEIKKDIWECQFQSKRYIFNMEKWHGQISKIYSLFFFFIYVEVFNRKIIKSRGILNRIKIKQFDDFKIKFIKLNGHIVNKSLIKNGSLRKNPLVQLKITNSLQTNGSFIDWKHIFFFKKQEISNFYIFKTKDML